MKKIGSYEAKTHLPKLLKQTAKGEKIMELREFRKAHTLGGIRLREMIEEGRRF